MSEEEAMLQRERMSPVRNKSRDRMESESGPEAPLPEEGRRERLSSKAPPLKPTRVDEEIRRKTVDRVAYFKEMSPELMTKRLASLDREWTVARMVMLITGLVSAGGLLGGWWYNHHSCYLITLVASIALLQHSITGWSPMTPLLRFLGVRTEKEVNAERLGLRLARGDFTKIDQSRADELVAGELSAPAFM